MNSMSKSELSGRFTSPRVPWTEEEMKLVLAYYFFIYENNTREQDYYSFTDDLKKLTKNNRSYGSVGVRFGNYISVDPRKNSTGFKGGDKKCKPIWDECINDDLTPKHSFILMFLDFINKYGNKKPFYGDFLRKYSSFATGKEIDSDDSFGIISSEDIDDSTASIPKYEPEPVPVLLDSKSKKYKRDNARAKKAIVNSNYKCDLDNLHTTFMTKKKHQYMEAHHLIPFGAQSKFNSSLDVDANIICLCPNCHRMLHYGSDIETALKKLYNDRKELLKKSGIEISFEELLKYYK